MIEGRTLTEKLENTFGQEISRDNLADYVHAIAKAPNVFEIPEQFAYWSLYMARLLADAVKSYGNSPIILFICSPLVLPYSREDFLDIDFCHSIMAHLVETYDAIQALAMERMGKQWV